MANIILFSSAFIRTASMALDEGTKRIRVNVTSSWTKEVRDKMDWAEPDKPKGFTGRTVDEAASSIDLEGEIQARNLSLQPNDKELKKLGIEFEIAEAKNFQLVTITDGNQTRKELRFQIVTTAAGALGEIERYADSVGQGKGELKISYVKQGALDLVDMSDAPKQTEERKKATAKEAD